MVVGRSGDRPDFLREPEFSRVVYRSWEDDDDDTLLMRGDLLLARRVVLLADDHDTQPDDDTIRTALSLVEQLRECDDDDPRRLLAEIVSIDHLPAARRATARAKAPLSATLVPTESLIAHAVAAVCRRQGLAGLLTHLLRSEGREIYACDAATDERGPGLSSLFGEAPLETLAKRGELGAAVDGVTPLGVVTRDEAGERRVLINPALGELDGPVLGLVAIAETGERVSELLLAGAGEAPTQPAKRIDAEFEAEPPLALRRILVCGFRPATVHLLEALLRDAEAEAAVHLLVADERSLDAAKIEFQAHGMMVRQGLHPHAGGAFSEAGEQIVWLPHDDSEPRIEIHLSVADWTSPRTLGELPGGLGSAIDFDLVLFSADGSGESDARNTTGIDDRGGAGGRA